MRRLTVKQIDSKIEHYENEIEKLRGKILNLNKEREITKLYDQIAEKRKAMKPTRKRVSRKTKTDSRKAEKAPNSSPEPQTPAEPTPIKPKRSRGKKQAEPESNHKPLYKCKNGHEFEIPKTKNGITVCPVPNCETTDIEPIE